MGGGLNRTLPLRLRSNAALALPAISLLGLGLLCIPVPWLRVADEAGVGRGAGCLPLAGGGGQGMARRCFPTAVAASDSSQLRPARCCRASVARLPTWSRAGNVNVTVAAGKLCECYASWGLGTVEFVRARHVTPLTG